MRWGLLLWAVVLSGPVWAMDPRPIKRGPASQVSLPPQPEVQDGTVPVEVTEDPVGTKSSAPVEAAAAPAGLPNWAVTGNYSYADLWVPGKFGVTLAYRLDEKSWVEFDYMRGSFSTGWIGVDLGRVIEQRAVIQWRHFPWARRFNWFVGTNYNDLEVTLGDSALATVSALETSEYELMRLTSLGGSAGFGHRWVFANGFVLAVDWLHVHVPVLSLKEDAPFRDATTDPDRKTEADDLVRFVQKFPRFAALKLQLGLSF